MNLGLITSAAGAKTAIGAAVIGGTYSFLGNRPFLRVLGFAIFANAIGEGLASYANNERIYYKPDSRDAGRAWKVTTPLSFVSSLVYGVVLSAVITLGSSQKTFQLTRYAIPITIGTAISTLMGRKAYNSTPAVEKSDLFEFTIEDRVGLRVVVYNACSCVFAIFGAIGLSGYRAWRIFTASRVG